MNFPFRHPHNTQYTAFHSYSIKWHFFFASFNKLQHIDRSSIKQFFNNIACFMSLTIGPTSSSNIPITFSFISFTCYGYVHTFNPPQILVVFFFKNFFFYIHQLILIFKLLFYFFFISQTLCGMYLKRH